MKWFMNTKTNNLVVEYMNERRVCMIAESKVVEFGVMRINCRGQILYGTIVDAVTEDLYEIEIKEDDLLDFDFPSILELDTRLGD